MRRKNNQILTAMKPFILVEKFDIIALLEAFSDGRLFTLPSRPSDEDIRQMGISDILKYVSHIDGCVRTNYVTHIRTIWDALVTDPEFGELFFLKRYWNTRGMVNWYRVNVIISLLREHGVYDSNLYTNIDLYMRCESSMRNEHTTLKLFQNRHNYYTGMGRYLLNRKQLTMFRTILSRFSV